MTVEKIKELVAQMTLEEKVSMLSGQDNWHTQAVERLGIPAVMVADGPHGLRKQEKEADHMGINESVKAVCFPAGCATASSFSRETLTRMGEALGEECQAEDVSVILGPGTNIKRSPLCGRNFEYFSEDPYLASEIAASHIKGVQSKNVGTSLKHFLANNQETRRLTCSSNIDERTLREIYLASFEGAVKKGKPWTVMCSYNLVNGEQVSHNKRYLTDILRDEWGFDGYVMSDWGAVADRVRGVEAGLDLEMPSSNGAYDSSVTDAVNSGELDIKAVDAAVERILNIVYKYYENHEKNAVYDKEKHHDIARGVAEETAVLLKNEGALPIAEGTQTVLIGPYAKKPRYQGGGSSHINSFKVVSACDASAGWENVTYVPGFEDNTDESNEAMIAEAVEAARSAHTAVIFAGLPDSFESEGYDRTHMRMPGCQNELIRRVAEVQKNTVVVLHNGSPVEMPLIQEVNAVLEGYLGGQAVGESTVNILFGKTNPSGRLAETFPLRLEDNPSYLNFPGEEDEVDYREGIFVGYRYYDKKKLPVLFPFGHGLSYTTFAYSNMRVSAERIQDCDTLTVSVDVTNTGTTAGKEVVQLYVADTESTAIRPVRELKGFEKIALEPGQTGTVTFNLDKRAFAYYNTKISDWYVESGEFEIEIAKSSRDIVLHTTVFVESTVQLPVVFTPNTLIGELEKTGKGKELIENLMKNFGGDQKENEEEDSDGMKAAVEAMLRSMPVRGMLSFGGTGMKKKDLDALLDELNRK